MKQHNHVLECFSVSFNDAACGHSHASIHLSITAETRITAIALDPHATIQSPLTAYKHTFLPTRMSQTCETSEGFLMN